MDNNKERFLIIRLGAIGDIIHVLPCADYLKKSYPNSILDWVVDESNLSLLNGNPNIDNIYTVPLKKWKKSWLSPKTIAEIIEFNKKLKQNNYSWAFDLHGMFKSLVISAFTGAKNRVAYKDYREFATLGANILVESKAKRPYRNYSIIQRYLDLIKYSGLEDLRDNYKPKGFLPKAKEETVKNVDFYLNSLDKNKKTIMMSPKTTWDTKHWDKNEWKKLYNYLKYDYNIVFSGVKGDLNLIEEIKNGDNLSITTAGKTNMEEYIELVRRCDIVISPDSSASHIAWAVQEKLKPQVITIFCSTSKYTFSTPNSIAFPLNEQKCLPCHKKTCKFKHKNCTRNVKAEEVYEIVQKLLTKD